MRMIFPLKSSIIHAHDSQFEMPIKFFEFSHLFIIRILDSATNPVAVDPTIHTAVVNEAILMFYKISQSSQTKSRGIIAFLDLMP